MVDGPVAVVFHRFGPYHLARLEAAARLMPVTGIEIVAKDRVYAWDVVRGPNGFRRVTLFETDSSCAVADVLVRRMWAALDAERPAAVALPGWASREALAGLAWAQRRSIPAILMSDSQRADKERGWPGEWVKRQIVGLYSAALVGGSRQTEYTTDLGMPLERIVTGYGIVDNHHFARNSDAVRREPGLCERMGLPQHFFLSCCRFVPEKNLVRLLEGYAKYRRVSHDPWDLVLVGDGPLRTEVGSAIERLGIEGKVHTPGFQQYDEVPLYYGLAGAFVLASVSETWGMVINEAMAAGLPVLVSRRCGCAPDLVEEGGNGFTFDPYSTDELARLMLKISSLPEEQREAMGRRSREIIQHWGPERFAEGMKKAVQAALSAPRPKATILDKALLWALIYRPGAV